MGAASAADPLVVVAFVVFFEFSVSSLVLAESFFALSLLVELFSAVAAVSFLLLRLLVFFVELLWSLAGSLVSFLLFRVLALPVELSLAVAVSVDLTDPCQAIA